MRITQSCSPRSWLGAAAAAVFALGLSAFAWGNEHDEGYEHHHHYHHHGYEIKPHNAAIHMLMMAHAIGLDHQQVQKLMKMRDEYIKKNAVAEKMIKVERGDLKWLLYADKFDKQAVDKKLGEIGKLEGQLWNAYVDQLAEINSLLTAEQKHKLKEMYSPHHGMRMNKMGEERGEHGMGDHDMGDHGAGDHGDSMRNNMED